MLPELTRPRLAFRVVTLAAVLTAACGRADPAADWTVTVEPLNPPSSAASFAPQLTESDAGVVLSWIERAGPGFVLRFAEPTPDGWSPPRTAASGTNWFASWADAPSVLRLSTGTLVAAWFVNTRVEIEAYDTYLSYSTDDGQTWSTPFMPHRDGTQTQHGFATLFETPDRGLGLVWLDGRDMENNTTDPEGGVMTLRYTSFDTAWTQGEDMAIQARVCECCQTAAVVTGQGLLTAFRNRTEDEIRDVFVSRLEGGAWTTPRAVHDDNWEIWACPVNGPALSARGDEVVAAWFTVKDDEGHAYAAFSRDAGDQWSAPIRLDEHESMGYVDVVMLDDGSAVASWVEFHDQRRRFRMRRIEASGAMSAPIDITSATDDRVAGYPRLARSGDALILSWTESRGDERGDGTGQQVKGAIARLPRTAAP